MVSESRYTVDHGDPDTNRSDEARWSVLMVSAQSGNESDYRQLLEELTRVIHNFLRSRFGPHDVIEDCVQEVLISIHHARHTYNPKRPFRAWLFAIVRNKAIDFLRQKRSVEKKLDHYRRDQEVLGEPENRNVNRDDIVEGPDRISSRCYLEILIHALPPALVALFFIRRLYPLNFIRTSMAAGLAAGMIPALYMQLACAYEPVHILTLHILPGLCVVLVAAAVATVWRLPGRTRNARP